jgi:hypothetical protein
MFISITGGTSGSLTGVFTLTDDQAQDLKDERLYVQVYTEDNRRGELRGQLTSEIDFGFDAEALIGFWEGPHPYHSHYLLFNSDGTYLVSHKRENLEETAYHGEVYEMSRDRLVFETDYHEQVAGCAGAIGTYTVMASKDRQLQLLLHEDDCLRRVENLQGVPLLPLEH